MKTCVWLDATQLSPASASSGVGTYVSHLLEALAVRRDVDVLALTTEDATLPPGVQNMTVKRRLQSGRSSAIEQELRRTLEIRRRHGAVFHNPNTHPPAACPRPWVQTLHDVIPLVYDDPVMSVLKKRFERFGPRYRRADAVIAVSRHAADEGIRLWNLDPARIEVIHHGVGARFRAAPGGPADPPYVSVVAEFSKRKGFDVAFSVVAELAASGYPHRLVVAGKVQPWYAAEFETLVAAAPRPDRLEVLGFVDDLPAVYRGSSVHLVTSRYEGFGFPALEAMASGVPVVAFANSSIPEVVGDAGVLVPDGDVAAMVRAVRRVLDDPVLRSELSQAGLERAGAFTWAASAARHAEVYARVASSK